jgi:hypothetical protein
VYLFAELSAKDDDELTMDGNHHDPPVAAKIKAHSEILHFS